MQSVGRMCVKFINTNAKLHNFVSKNSVPLSKLSVCVTKTSHSILYREIISVCFEVHLRHRGADKSLARPTSRCTIILFDGDNISFDVSLVLYIYIYIYINSTNIPLIMIINRIYEHQNLLWL